MEVKPGYKQTEVGVIPEDWVVKPLSAISDKIMVGIASAATHAYRTKGVPMFRNQDIKNGYLSDSDLLFIAPEYEISFKNKRLRGGDLLTMRTGYPGVTAIVPARYESAQSFTTLITRLKQHDAESAYLCHFINSEVGQRFFTQSQIGGAQKNVNAGTLREMPVPLPKPPEQRAIAEALGDVDALLGALDRLITKKRDLKQAAMQQLLTGQTRLPGFEGEWEVKTIDQVGLVTSGKRLPLGCSLVDQPTPHPYVRVTDMRPGTVSLSEIKYVPESVFPAIKYYRIYCEDIFISVAGSLGIIGKVPRELDGANLTENADRITKLTCSQNFLLHVLMSPLIQNTIDSIQTVGAQPKLALTRIRKFTIPHPSLPEQTAIAEVLSDMDAELAELERRRDKTRRIKQGMMQELLTGRTRLL